MPLRRRDLALGGDCGCRLRQVPAGQIRQTVCIRSTSRGRGRCVRCEAASAARRGSERALAACAGFSGTRWSSGGCQTGTFGRGICSISECRIRSRDDVELSTDRRGLTVPHIHLHDGPSDCSAELAKGKQANASCRRLWQRRAIRSTFSVAPILALTAVQVNVPPPKVNHVRSYRVSSDAAAGRSRPGAATEHLRIAPLEVEWSCSTSKDDDRLVGASQMHPLD